MKLIYIVSATSFSDSILGYYSSEQKAKEASTKDAFIWSEPLDEKGGRIYIQEPY